MKGYHTEHAVCVNSALINKHIMSEDKRENAFNYVYEKIVHLFRDDLESVKRIEDIHDDLIFETQYIIDRDSWDCDADEVAEKIYSDFDIKGSK